MKTTLLTLIAILLFAATIASAQLVGGYIDGQPHPIMIPSHPQHASEGSLLPRGDLYVRTATTMAEGTRPLWEFKPATPEVPLGDVARLYREQHASAKKAVIVLEQ